MVLCSEGRVAVACYLGAVPDGWDGSRVRVLSASDAHEPVAIFVFHGCIEHRFGQPNDEAFEGHPLFSKGLRPYRAFEVHESSWIRTLEQMNAVHPYHRPEHYEDYRHIVLAFHDSTFECVARTFTVKIREGSVVAAVGSVLEGDDGW
ncbi:MAG: hypothetical protein H6742_18370 [Alphaproteobacteria bacterium]|nr:hypothetical protein [Alphaproteobacteria bacterium]